MSDPGSGQFQSTGQMQFARGASTNVSEGKHPGAFAQCLGLNEAGILGFNPLQGLEVSSMLLEFLGKLAPPSILSGMGLDLKGKVPSMFGSAKG